MGHLIREPSSCGALRLDQQRHQLRLLGVPRDETMSSPRHSSRRRFEMSVRSQAVLVNGAPQCRCHPALFLDAPGSSISDPNEATAIDGESEVAYDSTKDEIKPRRPCPRESLVAGLLGEERSVSRRSKTLERHLGAPLEVSVCHSQAPQLTRVPCVRQEAHSG